MANQPQTEDRTTTAPPAGPQLLHSLEDLPASVGQVSRGPLGAVSRRDHTSWKSKATTEPGYWCGRIDSAIGEHVRARPIHNIAMFFGIGLLLGLMVNRGEGSAVD